MGALFKYSPLNLLKTSLPVSKPMIIRLKNKTQIFQPLITIYDLEGKSL